MATADAHDLDLLIEATSPPGRLRARVLNSPAGEASVDFDVPFTPLELENFLLKLGVPRSGLRGDGASNSSTAKTFGVRLFDAVFSGDVRRALDMSRAIAGKDGVRIRLQVGDGADLAAMPWEFLYDTGTDTHLGLDLDTRLVRYLPVPGAAHTDVVGDRLRVVVAIASPADLPALDVAGERDALTRALSGAEVGVDLEVLEHATLSGLHESIQRIEPHVIHFLGHGGFDEATHEGHLFFEDEYRHSVGVEADRFATLLASRDSIRLVVLNACEGGRVAADQPFGGVAQSLVRRHLPAVIAMQFPISDRAAVAFSASLYTSLARGIPIDSACSEGRLAVYADGNDSEWATPVLYLRATDGVLFTPRPSTPTAVGALSLIHI